MGEQTDARRDRWLRRLRDGERLRLHRGYRTRRRAVIALAVVLASVLLEGVMIARDAGLLQLMLLPLVLAILVLGHTYEWGRVAHGALQLAEDALLLWDWRNKVRRIRYGDLAAVACVRRLPRKTSVLVCHSEEGSTQSPEWTPVLTWHRSASAASAVAAELARRAGLTRRSEGLWTRPYCEDIPPLTFLD